MTATVRQEYNVFLQKSGHCTYYSEKGGHKIWFEILLKIGDATTPNPLQ